MNFLPDTNVLVGYYKGREPNKGFLTGLISKGKLYLSTVSLAEFLVGAQEDEKKKLDELCDIAEIVPIDRNIAEAAASYRKQFSRKTKKVYLLDCFLAASCKVLGLTLVTNDVSDYPMKDIKIIRPSTSALLQK